MENSPNREWETYCKLSAIIFYGLIFTFIKFKHSQARRKKYQMNNLIIITGMHRSGTSLLANILFEAGVFLGKDLLEPSEYNPKGYFENRKIVNFHDEILKANGTNWYLENAPKKLKIGDEYKRKAISIIEEYRGYQLAGWKDPRTTIFLDFWKELVPEAKFIFIYRRPEEVISSLLRRGDSSIYLKLPLISLKKPWKALRLWIIYNQKLLKFCQENTNDFILINSHDLIDREEKLYKVLTKKWGLPLASRLSVAKIFEKKYLNVETSSFQHLICSLSISKQIIWRKLNQYSL